VRIEINVPWRNSEGRVLTGPEVAAQAALIEESGLDGIWVADHLRANRPDPLMYLLVAAGATTSLELGTCIYIVPLRNTWRHMGDQIKRFRDHGGERALMATVTVDLRAPTIPPADDAPFYLQCAPEAATERLVHLDSLGFDDVTLHAGFAHTFTRDELEEVRSLMPRDPRAIPPHRPVG
jgi:hypothetical protein